MHFRRRRIIIASQRELLYFAPMLIDTFPGISVLLQVLLAMNAHVEDRGQKNDTTPLMEAASAGHVDIIRLLINHGADVNALSSTGEWDLTD